MDYLFTYPKLPKRQECHLEGRPKHRSNLMMVSIENTMFPGQDANLRPAD